LARRQKIRTGARVIQVTVLAVIFPAVDGQMLLVVENCFH
jgi:hypothetical protein